MQVATALLRSIAIRVMPRGKRAGGLVAVTLFPLEYIGRKSTKKVNSQPRFGSSVLAPSASIQAELRTALSGPRGPLPIEHYRKETIRKKSGNLDFPTKQTSGNALTFVRLNPYRLRHYRLPGAQASTASPRMAQATHVHLCGSAKSSAFEKGPMEVRCKSCFCATSVMTRYRLYTDPAPSPLA